MNSQTGEPLRAKAGHCPGSGNKHIKGLMIMLRSRAVGGALQPDAVVLANDLLHAIKLACSEVVATVVGTVRHHLHRDSQGWVGGWGV